MSSLTSIGKMRVNSSFNYIVLLIIIAAGCGDVGDAPRAQTHAGTLAANIGAEGLAIDTARSAIKWRAAKVTRAHDGGFRTFSGNVSVKDGSVTGVKLLIDARSIWSDTDRLTNHLKSPDFFDVEAYPQAEFVSSRIVAIDSAGASHLVTGNLTMHGKTNAITFPAKIWTQDGNVFATADFIIDRRDWGINYTGKADDLVRNDVRLIFDVVATDEPQVPVAESVK